MKGLENEFEEPFPEIPMDIELNEGEVLRASPFTLDGVATADRKVDAGLPPTPAQSIKEEEEEQLLWLLEEKERLRKAELVDVKLEADESPEERALWEKVELEELQREETEREIRVAAMEADEAAENELHEAQLHAEEEEERQRVLAFKEEAKRLA